MTWGPVRLRQRIFLPSEIDAILHKVRPKEGAVTADKYKTSKERDAEKLAAAVAALLAKIDTSTCMGDCCSGNVVRALAERVSTLIRVSTVPVRRHTVRK